MPSSCACNLRLQRAPLETQLYQVLESASCTCKVLSVSHLREGVVAASTHDATITSEWCLLPTAGTAASIPVRGTSMALASGQDDRCEPATPYLPASSLLLRVPSRRPPSTVHRLQATGHSPQSTVHSPPSTVRAFLTSNPAGTLPRVARYTCYIL